MSVEVLMATYNGEAFLEEQIESILNQEDVDFKLTISDGGSSDSTLSILENYQKKYPEKITYHRSEKRLNVVKNFSRLLSLSKGDYLLFSDQDDVWLPHKISKSLQACKEIEGKGCPVLIHSDLKVTDAQLKTTADSFWDYARLKPRYIEPNRLIVQNVITGCTVLINRPLADLMMPIPNEVIMHDWWGGIVASLFGRIGHVEEPLILYRQHGGNAVGAQNARSYSNLMEKRKLVAELYQKRRDQVHALVERFEAKMTSEQKQLLETYLKLYKQPYFKRKWQVFRYRFFPCSLLRSILSLIYVSYP